LQRHNIKNFLDSTTLSCLLFCEEQIAKSFTTEIPDKDIDNVKNEINKFYAWVYESEMDKSLKFSILNSLEHLLEAIHEYQMYGINNFDAAFNEAFGVRVFVHTMYKTVDASPEMKSFTETLAKLWRWGRFARDLKQLGGTLWALLGGPGPA
jgi:hypothetical protein